MARKKLGEMLLEAGVLQPDALRSALGEQRRWGRPLGRTLVDMRLIEESVLVGVLARQLAVQPVDLDKLTIPRAVLDLVSSELANQHHVVPFAQPMKFLDIAMADPTNLGIVDELRIRTQLNIRPFIAGPRMIERALAKYYGGETIEVAMDSVAMPSDASGRAHAPDARFDRLAPRMAPAPNRDAEIDALQQRISKLEAMIERDQQVLRALLALLVDKGVASRDEILARLK